jgi:hypothetical protein
MLIQKAASLFLLLLFTAWDKGLTLWYSSLLTCLTHSFTCLPTPQSSLLGFSIGQQKETWHAHVTLGFSLYTKCQVQIRVQNLQRSLNSVNRLFTLRYWGLNSRPLTLYALVYFLVRVSHFCLDLILDHNLPISIFWVAGITGMHHYTQPS